MDARHRLGFQESHVTHGDNSQDTIFRELLDQFEIFDWDDDSKDSDSKPSAKSTSDRVHCCDAKPTQRSLSDETASTSATSSPRSAIPDDAVKKVRSHLESVTSSKFCMSEMVCHKPRLVLVDGSNFNHY